MGGDRGGHPKQKAGMGASRFCQGLPRVVRRRRSAIQLHRNLQLEGRIGDSLGRSGNCDQMANTARDYLRKGSECPNPWSVVGFFKLSALYVLSSICKPQRVGIEEEKVCDC